MTLKNDGRERLSKKTLKKKQRPIKCECRNLINVEECIELEDFDYVDDTKTSIYVFCGMCGLQHKHKL